MADLSFNQIPINDIEVSNDAPLTESTMSKIGGAINFLLERRYRFAEFTTPGATTWDAPADLVGHIYLFGCGGGGGGAGRGVTNTTNAGGRGGYGVSPYMAFTTVTPTLTYSINIGAGGAGGANNTSGATGGDTTFGGLLTFKGAPQGKVTRALLDQASVNTYPLADVEEYDTALYSIGNYSRSGRGGRCYSVANPDRLLFSGANAFFRVGTTAITGEPGGSSPFALGGAGGTGGGTTGGGGGAGLGPGGNGGTSAGNGVAALSTSYGAGGGGGGGGAATSGGAGAGGYLLIAYQAATP